MAAVLTAAQAVDTAITTLTAAVATYVTACATAQTPASPNNRLYDPVEKVRQALCRSAQMEQIVRGSTLLVSTSATTLGTHHAAD